MFFPGEQYFDSRHLKKGLKRRSINAASVTLISQLLASVIKVIGAIILARILAPDDFGLLSMTATIILLLQNFGVNGFTEAIVQQDRINHREVSTLFWANILISLALALILVSMSSLVAKFYHDVRLIPIINVMSISILMGGVSTHHIALLQRNMKFTRVALIRLTGAVMSVVIGITLAQKDFGYWALVGRRLSLPAVIAIGAWLLCTWVPGLPRFSKQVKELFFFGIFTYGNFIMNYLRMNIDKILIGRVLDSEQLGFYDRAYHLANQIPQQMIVPISGVFISALSRLRNEPERYKRYVRKLLSTLSFLCMPVSILLTIIGKDLIVLLLGSHWHEAGRVFTVMGPGVGMLVVYRTHAWIHLSLGKARRLFKWGVFSLLFTIALFITGIQYGTVGVGMAYSASFFLLTLPALWYAGKPARTGLSFFIKCLWRPFVASLVAGVISKLMMNQLSLRSQFFIEMHIFTELCVTILIFGIMYCMLSIIISGGVKPFTEIISILKEIGPFKRVKK